MAPVHARAHHSAFASPHSYILEIVFGWSATVREYVCVCVWLMVADGH